MTDIGALVQANNYDGEAESDFLEMDNPDPDHLNITPACSSDDGDFVVVDNIEKSILLPVNNTDDYAAARRRRRKRRLIMAGVGTGVGVVAAVGAVVAAPFVIAAAGFGTAGVVAGSIAAGVQSSIGSVAAGSLFATLQSAGAVGLTVGANAGIAAGGAAAGAGLGTGVAAIFNRILGRKGSVTAELETKSEDEADNGNKSEKGVDQEIQTNAEALQENSRLTTTKIGNEIGESVDEDVVTDCTCCAEK